MKPKKKRVSDVVHKATNLPAVTQDESIEVQTTCKLNAVDHTFWFSHWWRDVNCKRCLEQKEAKR